MRYFWVLLIPLLLSGCLPSFASFTAEPVAVATEAPDFHWRLSGEPAVAPQQIFSDKQQIWLHFAEGQSIPAIFGVKDGQLYALRYRYFAPYVLLEGRWSELLFQGGHLRARAQHLPHSGSHSNPAQAPQTTKNNAGASAAPSARSASALGGTAAQSQNNQGNQSNQGSSSSQNNQGPTGSQNSRGYQNHQGNRNNLVALRSQNKQGEQVSQNNQSNQRNQNSQDVQGNQNKQDKQGSQGNEGPQSNSQAVTASQAGAQEQAKAQTPKPKAQTSTHQAGQVSAAQFGQQTLAIPIQDKQAKTASAINPSTHFHLGPADETLRQVFQRWAKQEGWHFTAEHWELEIDYPILNAAEFEGGFISAVEQVLKSVRLAAPPLRACFHSNRVLRIIPETHSCQPLHTEDS